MYTVANHRRANPDVLASLRWSAHVVRLYKQSVVCMCPVKSYKSVRHVISSIMSCSSIMVLCYFNNIMSCYVVSLLVIVFSVTMNSNFTFYAILLRVLSYLKTYYESMSLNIIYL